MKRYIYTPYIKLQDKVFSKHFFVKALTKKRKLGIGKFTVLQRPHKLFLTKKNPKTGPNWARKHCARDKCRNAANSAFTTSSLRQVASLLKQVYLLLCMSTCLHSTCLVEAQPTSQVITHVRFSYKYHSALHCSAHALFSDINKKVTEMEG